MANPQQNASWQGSQGSQSSQGSEGSQGSPGSPGTLKGYITADMAATTLFVMRMVTIVCTLLFVLSTMGLFGGATSFYLNAMLTSLFTFIIRLHQRQKQANINLFSRAMLTLLSTEDSGHYMLYTFFYYNQLPLTIYLLPVFLYAVLFSVTYTQGLAPFLPSSIQSTLNQLNAKIASAQREIKRFIAYAEVFIMLFVIWNVITGSMFILAPLMHYQFLRLRYSSKRNPYVRIVFSDLRMTLQHLTAHPRCPTAVATLVNKAIELISRLAPHERMQREA